ncbi:hypothetical protein M5689_002436 [Euphorbia peplus]|nr:hypothetical protein M5689_002436 [Euphorbia peplus]
MGPRISVSNIKKPSQLVTAADVDMELNEEDVLAILELKKRRREELNTEACFTSNNHAASTNGSENKGPFSSSDISDGKDSNGVYTARPVDQVRREL